MLISQQPNSDGVFYFYFWFDTQKLDLEYVHYIPLHCKEWMIKIIFIPLVSVLPKGLAQSPYMERMLVVAPVYAHL